MKSHPLSLKESEQIQFFLDSYPTVNKKLDDILKTLDTLLEDKDMLIESLVTLREEEKALTEALEAKYGKGDIDVKSWTYITK